MEQLKKAIIDSISTLSGTISVYIKYLRTNDEIRINEQIQMSAASIIKIPILCEFYNQVNQDKVDVKRWIKIKNENIVEGSGVLKLLNQKTEYTIHDIARFMIILSDNSATNEIVDLIGWENIEAYMKKLSLSQITFRHKMMIKAGRGENLITAEDIGSLLEKIYRGQIDGFAEILDIMKLQQLRNYLPKLIPQDIQIASKTGASGDVLHDVGIVFSHNPFIFIFLSEQQKLREETGKILSQCAKHCFDYSTKKLV